MLRAWRRCCRICRIGGQEPAIARQETKPGSVSSQNVTRGHAQGRACSMRGQVTAHSTSHKRMIITFITMPAVTTNKRSNYHFYGSLPFASYHAMLLVLCVYNASCASIFSTATVQLLSSSPFDSRAKVRLTRPSLRQRKLVQLLFGMCRCDLHPESRAACIVRAGNAVSTTE